MKMIRYKAVTFDPSRPLRVSFLNQPALDTGGIRRQFFTDVLDEIAFKDPHSMFMGDKHHLHPTQLLPLLVL